MTTTRYAIELEPGKYRAWGNVQTQTKDFADTDLFNYSDAKDELKIARQYHPHARIVKVKCEVQDEA